MWSDQDDDEPIGAVVDKNTSDFEMPSKVPKVRSYDNASLKDISVRPSAHRFLAFLNMFLQVACSHGT